MNAQNPVELETRAIYYSIIGTPESFTDGTIKSLNSSLSQSQLNAEYAVASPFTITLTHTLSTHFDSIFIHAVITAFRRIPPCLLCRCS